jgi:histidinol-phosphate phosphatase family protein
MRAWPREVKRAAPAPTAFLDRDGTINRDRAGSYITSPEKLKIYAGVPAALRLLTSKGYRVVILTNQSAVARGYMPLSAAKAINLKLVRELRRGGARVDAVYFCPHGPDEGCSCRKPEPGLIKEAVKDSPADLDRSFMAGDKKSDLELARRAGIKGYLVLTGQWRSAGPAAAKKGFRSLAALARAVPDVSERKNR